jgi:hypothetical protein
VHVLRSVAEQRPQTRKSHRGEALRTEEILWSGLRLGWLILGCVGAGAVVRYVGQVLGRAYALFGDSPAGSGAAAVGAGHQLTAAGGALRCGQRLSIINTDGRPGLVPRRGRGALC